MSKKEAQQDEQDFEDIDSAISAAFTSASDEGETSEPIEEISEDVDSVDFAEDATEESASDKVETVEVESGETADETAPPIEAPAFFNSEEKEAFKTYPREMQQAIERVASGLRRRVSEDTQKLAPLRRLGDVIAPAIPEMQRLGLTPDQFIGNLIRARAMLLQDPIAGLEALGVNTQQLLNGMGQGDSESIPAVLQERLQRVESHFERQQREQQAREYQDQFGLVRSFRDERDSEGRLARPLLEIDPVTESPRYPEFVGELQTQIDILRAGGPATRDILERAYQRALRLSDEAQSITEQRKKAEEVKKRQQTLQGKKAASSSLGNSASRGKTKPASEEYDLGKAIDKLFASA